MRILLALVVLALLPAGARAAEPPLGAYRCVQTLANYGPTGIPSYYAADRGELTIEAASYGYDATFLEREARAGGWAWDGERGTFESGPLARPDEGWSVELVAPGAAAMPHDPVPGRTWPVVLRSLTETVAEEAPAPLGQEGDGPYQASHWYCGDPGTDVRRAVGARLRGYVRREAGVPVRLPGRMPIGVFDRLRPRVIVLTEGSYRIGMATGGHDEAIFSARRAPASELGVRRRVKLGNGLVGSVGTYGCAFNGTDPDWGPRYCGRFAIVWHQRGVNYCIEAVGGVTEADLVRAARQAAR